MLAKELTLQNPLRLIGHETEDILPEGGFGVVLARAGIGKTALLVQLSLHNLFQNKNSLHVSLDDPVKKVNLWYKEVFSYLTKSYDVGKANQIWEAIIPHRFIMTFKAEAFNLLKLEERLTDLREQNIFAPQVIFFDGFPFNENVKGPLSKLKDLSIAHSFKVWFTMRTHRHEKPGLDGMPAPLFDFSEMFEVVIQLQPEGKEIHVKTLKGGPINSDSYRLILDPSTMLIKNTG
jgi:hypothetical protein